MLNTVQDAFSVIRAPSSEDDYLLACGYLVEHRDQLTQRVFINLPGGLRGNSSPAWDAVKAGSQERCSCGNERVIIPLNPRTEYEASSAGAVVVTKNTPVYLKPVGGDKTSAFVRLDIEQAAVTFLEDPFAPIVLTPDIFSTKGYKLKQLADVMPNQPAPPVFIRKFAGVSIPIFAINVVDPSTETVTITPDAAVEVFNPDTLPDHECA